MSFKSIVRELKEIKESIGSISRGSGGSSSSGAASRRASWLHHHSRPLPEREVEVEDGQQTGKWASLPPELLLDILQRVDAGQPSWPVRRNVVACATLCRTWREIMKEVVKPPEKSGRLTFPISLKQPGPREPAIQCFIRRERATSTYRLYLGLSPALQEKNDKLLLAARKVRRATSTDFVISFVSNEFSRASSTFVGKLRSNFVGTKFTVYDSQLSCYIPVASSSKASHRIHAKQVSPRVPARNYSIATIAYELNVLRGRGPRRMLVTMDTIPVSALKASGTAPTQLDEHILASESRKGKEPLVDFSKSLNEPSTLVQTAGEPLVLKNKAPRWHEQLQCWCLNFKGRVTVASVKNFQLVAAINPSHDIPSTEQERIILQFGKIGKDIFTMDYRYPLSAYQAFAICLSSFDTKPACE